MPFISKEKRFGVPDKTMKSKKKDVQVDSVKIRPVQIWKEKCL